MRPYKPTKFSIEIIKGDRRGPTLGDKWTIIVDDIAMSPLEVSNKYKVPRETIYDWLNNKTLKQFAKWLENRADLVQLGLPPTTSRLYRKGNEVCWTALVAAEAGCSYYEACKRLNAWESNDDDCDTLFSPITKKGRKQHESGGANWGGLSDDEREYNLDKIAEGGSWEEKHVPIPEDGMGTEKREHFVGSGSAYISGIAEKVPLMRGD